MAQRIQSPVAGRFWYCLSRIIYKACTRFRVVFPVNLTGLASKTATCCFTVLCGDIRCRTGTGKCAECAALGYTELFHFLRDILCPHAVDLLGVQNSDFLIQGPSARQSKIYKLFFPSLFLPFRDGMGNDNGSRIIECPGGTTCLSHLDRWTDTG